MTAFLLILIATAGSACAQSPPGERLTLPQVDWLALAGDQTAAATVAPSTGLDVQPDSPPVAPPQPSRIPRTTT